MGRLNIYTSVIRKLFSGEGNKDKIKNSLIFQRIYNEFGFGHSEEEDYQLLSRLEEENKALEDPFIATGQSSYFNEQIEENGLGSFRLNKQDIEDARFISACFGKNTMYSENNIPVTYMTLLGTTEFNYATQRFPAGIFEDVFQCSVDHNFPIQPLVGESERAFYIRLLEHQIDTSEVFNKEHKEEALARGARLIDNFCKGKSRVYLVRLSDIMDIKASFGDVNGLRDGTSTPEESQQIIQELPTFSQLLTEYNIEPSLMYNDPNMQSEFGIALYGSIPRDKIQYIEVESKYDMMQRRSIELGIKMGEAIPMNGGEDIVSNINKQ